MRGPMNSRAANAKCDPKEQRRACVGSLWLASLILFGCHASADERADAVTRSSAAEASIRADGTVASLTSAPVPLDQSTKSSVETLLASSSAAYDATTRLDAEWSAESSESGEATPASSTSGPMTTATEPRWSTPAASRGAPVKGPPSWPWMVFVLSGNATVAARRQRDLGTYLRLNLAARLDADYNDVAINRILLTGQSVLANISVEPSHLAASAGLEALGRGNVTLLELSGNEFQVDRIIRFDGALDQRDMMNLEMASMVASVGSEVTVYGAVGAVFLFLLVALLLGLSFNSPCRNENSAKYLSGASYDRDQTDAPGQELLELRTVPAAGPACPPPVIYSEQLAREMCDSASLLPRAHFIPSAWSPAPADSWPAQLHRYQPDPRRPRAHGKRDHADQHHSPRRC